MNHSQQQQQLPQAEEERQARLKREEEAQNAEERAKNDRLNKIEDMQAEKKKAVGMFFCSLCMRLHSHGCKDVGYDACACLSFWRNE